MSVLISLRALVCGSLLASPCWAGTVLTFEGKIQGMSFRNTIMLDGVHVRIDSEDEDERTSVILNTAKRQLILVNTNTKSVTVLAEGDLSELKRRQRALAAPVPQQAAPTTFEPTGTPKPYARFRCRPFRHQTDGVVDEEGCFIPWDETAIKPADLKALDELEALMQDLATPDPPQRGPARLSHYPGLPASLRVFEAVGSLSSEEALKALRHQALPTRLFEPPGGFRKGQRRPAP